ncbi:hypothetical protein PanWU01x14_310310 [Parasponia andersonii]|uniref:Uncharacterized protein n=1 Tax=Parasponia andersonii TaxID=3476 RepID=A0A2P5AQH1_PARAD|nr:hypothetical protein PanWU01x14_310310 [Parasponia andersonii]
MIFLVLKCLEMEVKAKPAGGRRPKGIRGNTKLVCHVHQRGECQVDDEPGEGRTPPVRPDKLGYRCFDVRLVFLDEQVQADHVVGFRREGDALCDVNEMDAFGEKRFS